MAQKIEVQLIDDLDGSEATQTITFGFDGVEYAIDLNDENGSRLKEILTIHASVARRVSGRKARSANKVKSGEPSEAQTIREWVRAQGHEISDRGRIPQKWVEEYHQSKNVAQEPSQPQEQAPKVEETKPKRAPRKPAANKSVGAAATELGKILTFEEPKTASTTKRRRATTPRASKSTTK